MPKHTSNFYAQTQSKHQYNSQSETNFSTTKKIQNGHFVDVDTYTFNDLKNKYLNDIPTVQRFNQN